MVDEAFVALTPLFASEPYFLLFGDFFSSKDAGNETGYCLLITRMTVARFAEVAWNNAPRPAEKG